MEKYCRIGLSRSWLTESCLFLSVVFYWVSTSLINPIAIVLLALLITLFVSKSRWLGLILSFLFLILSLYMVLALISEMQDFIKFDNRSITLITVGFTFLTLNIIVSAMMLKKWGKMIVQVG
jgi:hypothetical protein